MTTETLTAPGITLPQCEARIRLSGGPLPPYCQRRIALDRFVDQRGITRYACQSDGHRANVEQRYGVGPTVCRICKGELDQDYTAITEGGFVCWRCREKADLPEDQEWVAHLDGGRFGDIEVDVV